MDDIYKYYVTEDCNDEQLLKYWNEVYQSIEAVSFVQKSEWFNAYLKSDLENDFYFCFIYRRADVFKNAVTYKTPGKFAISLSTGPNAIEISWFNRMRQI